MADQVHRRHGRAPLPHQDGPGPLLDGGFGDGRVVEAVHLCHERLQGPAVLSDHARGGEDQGVGVLLVIEKLKEEDGAGEGAAAQPGLGGVSADDPGDLGRGQEGEVGAGECLLDGSHDGGVPAGQDGGREGAADLNGKPLKCVRGG